MEIEKLVSIIAIDPSLCMSGVAIFEGSRLAGVGKIKTRKPLKGARDERLRQIAGSFNRNLFSFPHSTTKIVLAIESQYICGRFGNSILKVAEVTGVIKGVFITWANENGLKYEIINIAPSEAKKAVGMRKKLKRKESKIAVMECVKKLYHPSLIPNQDIADAVAIGHAALNRLKSRKT